MTEMEATATAASAPRRRETFASIQLQRAAEQLQEAIQSSRQHRSLNASSVTSLSLLSELSSDDEDADEDRENRALNNQSLRFQSPQRTFQDSYSKFMLKPARRFTLDSSSLTLKDSTLSLKDLHASPVRETPIRMTESQVKMPAGEAQSSGCIEELKKPVTNSSVSQLTESKEDAAMLTATVEAERKALTLLQAHVEAQARSNKALEDELRETMRIVARFVDSAIGEESMVALVGTKHITVDHVRTLSDACAMKLESWREDLKADKEELHEKLAQATQVVTDLSRSHDIERATFEALHRDREDQIRTLQGQLEAEQSRYKRLETETERRQMEAEESLSRLLLLVEAARAKASESASVAVDSAIYQDQERHVLSLLAQLKQSELREFQWEMMYDEQVQSTRQAQERLEMLLEDRACSSTLSRHASPTASRYHRSESFASSSGSSELQLYQQRIEFLEAQLQDVKAQVNCDHAQYLYEQQKWEFEKKHVGHDVEEVHGVSVKVLKLLLLREKLLKRQEQKLQRRADQLQRGEAALQENRDVLHASIESALQETAIALMYVRHLAMAAPSSSGASGGGSANPLPLKPIKLVRLLKRLKRLQDEQNEVASPHKTPLTT